MFRRTAILYGDDACEKIRSAFVVLCGVGAVGSFACEALARLGVGKFLLYDFDVFEQSNVNRQLCALSSTVGKTKVDVQRARILDINPNAVVQVRNVFIDENIANEIVSLRPTVVVDAIDSLVSKVSLAVASVKNSVPFVSSMGAARKKNPLQVATADISKTSSCPLAAKMRKQLRQFAINKGFKCVYSKEIVEKQTHICADKNSPSEKVIGSSVITTGVFGLNLANLALEEIIKG